MAETQRLFIGLSIPGHIRDRLTTLQPPSAPGLRPVSPEQMHVTLGFVGNAELSVIATAMSDIEAQSFIVGFDSLGKFGSARRGRGVLWVGMDRHPLLNDLYEAVGLRLANLDIAVDDRPFQPHVTLARCGKRTPAEVYRDFVQQPLPPLPTFEVNDFVIYSSKPGPDGSVYTPEATFPLAAGDDDDNGFLKPRW